MNFTVQRKTNYFYFNTSDGDNNNEMRDHTNFTKAGKDFRPKYKRDMARKRM